MRKVIFQNGFFIEIANLLKKGKSVKISICGNSMFPFLPDGRNLIELIPYNGEDVPLWTIIFYCWEGHYIVHRIVDKTAVGYITMGDGNLQLKEQVRSNDILGILSNVYYPNGRVQNCLSSSWLNMGKIWYHLRFFRRILIKILMINVIKDE